MNMTLSKLLIGTLMCAVAFGASGNNKLSSYTKLFKKMYEQGAIDANGMVVATSADIDMKSASTSQQKQLFTKMVNIGGTEMVKGFVKIADNSSIAEIESMGAVVNSEIGDDILIVSIPVDALESLSELESVEYIEIAKPVLMLNDEARSITNADIVQAGTGLNMAYTGKGVIVGIIDTGIDFNHINFKDDEGNSRVVRAYCDGKGTFDDPDDIAQLTTDYSYETHGTHVTGTAAGSYYDNGYQGMAPDADLYLCGTGSTTTIDIVEQAEKIVEYAKEQGQPVVINLSLGSNAGPHDGSNIVSQATDRLAGEGVIFIYATGNEGDTDLYVNKTFENETDAEQLKTIIEWGEEYSYNNFASYTTNPVSVQFMLIDTSNDNEVLYETDLFSPGESGGNWSLRQSNGYSNFSTYFSGNIQLEAQYDAASGKYEVYCAYSMSRRSTTSSDYKIAMKFYGTQGDVLNMWSDSYIEFSDNDDPEYTAGTSDCSVSELATGSEVISVGAYTSKVNYTNYQGNRYSYSSAYYTLNTMGYFSSYGYDMNGVWHPTVVAPGCAAIVSSYSRYYRYAYDYAIVSQEQIDDVTYQWGTSAGTSMATPVVTGIVATWLQYNPTLTTDDIKEIIAATAQKTDEYGTGIALQWGPNGLIDAYAGLQYILTSGINDVTKDQNVVIVSPNPSDGQFKVMAQGEDNVALAIYSINGYLVYQGNYTTVNGSVDVDLKGQLSSGIYLLRVSGRQCNYSGKLIIK